MWKAFLAVAFKEILHASRDKNSLMTLVIVQVLYLLMLGFIDVNARNLPTVVVDQDRSAESREFIQKLQASRTFDVVFVTSSVAQARDHIRAGRANVGIVIPSDFHRDRVRGESPQLLALVDGSDATASGQAVGAFEGIAARLNVETQRDNASQAGGGVIDPRSVMLFNPQGRNADFVLPGLLAFIMSIGFTIMSAGAILKERIEGTLDRLLMTPLNSTGLILGKMLPYFVLGVIDSVVYLAVMRWAFGVPIRGSLLLVLGAMALYTLTILSLGALLGSAARSWDQAHGPINLVAIASTFLTGYIWPLSCVPKVLLPLAYLLPPTHMIAVMRGICLRGAGVFDLLPNLAYLVLAPTILVFAAVKRFNGAIRV